MQFTHPEILWGLFFSGIPILIHLFQLRKFKKTPFTNVQFLKQVKAQTRKSSQLKKWLILIVRTLALASIIIAFAQPYFANNTINTPKETVIYVDNSFSMQAKGEKGALLQRAIQELIVNIPEEQQITLFTNTKTFSNTTIQAIKNDLLAVKYSSNQLDASAVLVKANTLFNNKNSSKDFIWISDFQVKNDEQLAISDSLLNINLVHLKPVTTKNSSIDSAYISNKNAETLELTVLLSNQGENIKNLPVSLYNKEKLVAKTSVNINGSKTATTIFSLPTNENIDGKITIDVADVTFDNTLFFNINTPQKIQVLAINEADDDFLKRMYTDDEFTTTSTTLNQLDYSLIANQNIIVLNELQNIPNGLQSALNDFTKNGGTVVIIPSVDSDESSYKQLLARLGVGKFQTKKTQEKKITTINYSHPLYNNVFNTKIQNFQYPKVNSFYTLLGRFSNILAFEDGTPFLFQKDNIFVFTAALNEENSNFKNSPLIVPTFYNIGKNSLQLPKLYYTMGLQNNVDVKTTLQQDEILKIANEKTEFIPLQQTFANKVRLTTTENPQEAGIFTIKNNDENLENISFNYDRSESILTYHQLKNIENVTLSKSVTTSLNTIKSKNNVKELWKWFLIFALLFLIIEMLLLKFFK